MILFVLVILGLGCYCESVSSKSTSMKQNNPAEYFNVLIGANEIVSFELETDIYVEDADTTKCSIYFRAFFVNFGGGDVGTLTIALGDQETQNPLLPIEGSINGDSYETVLSWQEPEGNYSNRFEIPCESSIYPINMFHDTENSMLFSVDFVGSIFETTTPDATIQTHVRNLGEN